MSTRFQSGENVAVRDFLVVNEEKLAVPDDATFLVWRKQGYLPLIYAHLMSLANFASLIDRDRAGRADNR